MTDFICADCAESRAIVFLPEGRYLCGPCWARLRELRHHVITGTAKRASRQAKEEP